MQTAHLLLTGAALALAQGAIAQDQPVRDYSADTTAQTGGLEDIIVTSQRFAESLQKSPVTVTAVSATDIARRNITEVSDLQAVAPGVSFAEHSGFARIFIRGIGMSSIQAGQDASVAVQVDGVVIGRPFAQLASFFDLERIEVLRGPQGTLYGRNATGGVVSLVTAKPTDELSGYATAEYGNYNRVQLNGALSGALNSSGTIRARIAGQRITHDGYSRNITLDKDVNNQNSWAVRGQLAMDPTETVDILISADYARENDRNYSFGGFGPYSTATPMPGILAGGVIAKGRDVATEVDTENKRKFWGVSATIGIDLSDDLRLQSITGYRRANRHYIADPETTSAPIFSPTHRDETSKQFSEELQLTYTGGRLKGVAGLFYYKETGTALLDLELKGVSAQFGYPALYTERGDFDVKAWAAFTQWTYEVIDNVHLTAGVRYSKDKRSSTGTFRIFNFMPPPNAANPIVPYNTNGDWNAVTPKFGIDWSPSDNVMLYASATRGFKAGVLAVGTLNPPVQPEYIWSYEGGFKTTMLDRRLQLNGAGFYYNFTDLQVNRLVDNSFVTENAGKARIKGFELEMRAQPVPEVTLNADVTYLDAKFLEYSTIHPYYSALGPQNLKGNRLTNAPKWAFNVGAQFDLPIGGLPGNISTRIDYSWVDRVYFTEFNEIPLSQGRVGTIDMSIEYQSEDGRWTLGLWGKNLTDELVKSNVFIAAPTTGYALNGGYKDPRTYGVRVGYKF